MNQKKIIFAISITCLLCFQNTIGRTIITGKVTGDIPDRIEYSVPINGIVYGGFRESVKTDSSGSFEVKLRPKMPSFVIIMVPGKLANKMVVEPDKKYNISINLDKGKIPFEVLGVNSEGQNLYASLPFPSSIQIEVDKLKEDTTITLIKEKIAFLKANDISKFKELLDKKEISQAFFDLVQADRDCYYATLLATIPLIKFYKTEPEHINEFPLEMKQFWGNVFIDTTITQSDLMRSSFWFDYIKNYLNYKEFTQTDFSFQKIREFYEKGLFHTHNIQEAKKYISGDILEYYQAAYIYIGSLQKNYEKELITLFENFKKDWPNSEFIKYLEPMINPIREYYRAIEQPSSEKINFVKHCETFNSLKESLAQFKGKKIFIDVWATWCGPCKEEFKYKEKLLELLKSKGYEILYISIDREEKNKQWQEMVKYYNLEGYHIRTNEKFSDDLHSLFNNGKGKTITIPWYIIIGKNGDILNLHAHRPSELNELEKEFIEN